MSFTPRLYDELVRDLLTTLTGGTVRESVIAPEGNPPLVLPKLKNRPVRRVSNLEGTTQVGVGANARQIPFRFTAADFEVIATDGTATNLDAIRFRDGGRRPIPGTALSVNYYPVQTNPVPLTDLNVGSVTRTFIETFALELALSYQNLDLVYKSGFLDSAQDTALDRVVALIGVARLAAGFPVAKIRFSRTAGAAGSITIPAGTAVTDDASNRYLTTETFTLEPGELTREVLARGESPSTKLVDAGKLNRLEVLVAGISSVNNDQAARSLTAAETDDELRRRARGALQGVVRGTVDALRFGLKSIAEVGNVAITEAPNGVPGEIKIDIAYNTDTPAIRALVAARIEELRPAGIRVISGDAAKARVQVRVELTLAGAGISGDQLAALEKDLEKRLADYLKSVGAGATVRRAKLASLALQDDRIADAKIVLVPDKGTATEDLSLDAGQVIDLVQPFSFPSPKTEQASATPAAATVGATIPVHLVGDTTAAAATGSINSAIERHLKTRKPDAPLTVDGLLAAIRDDAHYAAIRKEVLVTVEGGGRFLQLTDGTGAYTPAIGETLTKGDIQIDVREGGV